MECHIEIPTQDNHIITGILNEKNQTNKLVIFVEGLGELKEYHTIYNGAKFFSNNNYSTFKFDFYSNNPRGRKLSECSIKTFTKDLNQILNYFKGKEIYIVGHSLGGPIIINSNQNNVKKIALWDGALFPKDTKLREFYNSKFTYIKELDKYIYNNKIEFLLSKELVEQRNLQDETILENIQRPIKLIMAEKFFFKDEWEEYKDKIPTEYEFTVINGANHGFDEEDKEEELFTQTLNWFEKNL